MPFCSSGISGPKDGVSEEVIFASGAIASILNNKGGFWAILAAPLIGVIAQDTLVFCASPPPTQPTISSAEYQALLDLAPWDTLQSALGKLKDIVLIDIWHQLCECKSVATPAEPTNLFAAPVGTSLATTTQSPAVRRTFRATADIRATSGTEISALAFINVPMFPELATVNVPDSPGFEAPHAASVLPTPSWTYVNMTVQLVSAGNNSPQNSSAQFLLRHSDFSWTQQMFATVSPSTPFQRGLANFTQIDLATAVSFDLAYFQTGGTVPAVADITLEFFTSGTSPTDAAYCLTDPAVLALLQRILDLVTINQRQLAPFAYVHGNVHTGLSGDGEIAVQGLMGILVTLIDIPTFVGSEFGHPNVLFETGWVNWGNAEGWKPREFLSVSSMTSFPHAAGQYTRIGYSFSPGVTAVITELLREPA